MKQLLMGVIFSFAILWSNAAIGQNTFPSSGNVGIGTSDPRAPLNVIGELRSQGTIRLQSPDGDDGGNVVTTLRASSANSYLRNRRYWDC